MFFIGFQSIFWRFRRLWVTVTALLALGGCFGASSNSEAAEDSHESPVAPADIVRTATPEFNFSADDHLFLETIERGCFNYLWNEVGVPGRLAKDRRTTPTASIAGIGFQLSSLPIAVERGWVTKGQAEERALRILHTLLDAPGNRRYGMFLHFVNVDNGRVFPPFNNEVGTVDHALLLAGAMPAAMYFGGDVQRLVDDMIAQTDWRAFQVSPAKLVNFGWRPADNVTLSGDAPGEFMTTDWRYASDEERIIYFLAVGHPNPDRAVEPRCYYRLERHVKSRGDAQPFVVSPTGSLFTYFFSHCWINYRGLGSDDPQRFDCPGPRVDWYENSRRATLTHRQRCIDASQDFPTLSAERWGLAPSMGQPGDKPGFDYIVPDVKPNAWDVENLQRGTIAPYAAGTAIMFTPQESLVALKAFRDIKDATGAPLVWRDPADGGYGFADSFNLGQRVACDDNVAIDVGPMLLGIENARSGLIWRLFMEHPVARNAVERLGLAPIDSSKP